MRIIEQLESEVRSYVRSFPVIFDKAKGSYLYDEQDNAYIDFFAGAGTLNYGHNNEMVSNALIEYIKNDGIVHGLDKATTAKKNFLQKLNDTILEPRNMQYKIQFPGPTGTNCVETALKLARMVKGRSNIITFTNGFHGLTMGSMSVTGNSFYRDEAFINRTNATFMPFDNYFGPDVDTIEYLKKFLHDKSSGVDLPAAFIVETIQAEGGVNVASFEWLKKLEQVAREFDIFLIIDDIQVGNGRTGSFFSFEKAGIYPDLICLSKSIGGGLPLSLLFMKPEIDQWRPGEHTGTFRGNNLAFIASTQALSYWDNNDLAEAVTYKENIIKEELGKIKDKYPDHIREVRGRGMIYGVDFYDNSIPPMLSAECFENGLIIELAGAEDNVLKLLPPLIIEEEILRKGISIIDDSIQKVLDGKQAMMRGEQ